MRRTRLVALTEHYVESVKLDVRVPHPARHRGGQAPRTTQPQPSTRAGPGHVVVVEDEADIRDTIAELLEDEGYSVEKAKHGAEALVHVERRRPDVVVLDLMMPVMDGWAFARACNARADGRAIPIVIMSASPDLARSAEQLHPYGVRAAVAKPFDLEVLLAVVGRLASRPAAVEWPR
jgi:two-component system, chemotaxis family, chemotaxis protein CheY